LDLLQMVSNDGIKMKKAANIDGGEFHGPCPFCNDGKDRFHIWPEKDRYWCRVCEAKGDMIEYLKSKHNMTFDEACAHLGKEKASKPKVINTKKWPLLDKDGNYIADHVRQESTQGKKYWWEIDGAPGLKGTKPPDLPLYGAELIGKKDGDVIVVEGEKCADSLRGKGYTAVATVCGAAVVPSEETLATLKDIKGDVLLWPDNDSIGGQHMEGVQAVLKTLGRECYWIKWHNCPAKGDAADYVSTGQDVDILIQMAKRRPIDRGPILIGEATHDASEMDFAMLRGEKKNPDVSTGFWRLDHAIGGWQKGLFYVLCARPGIGKTSFALTTAMNAATPEGKVLIFSLETVKSRVASRMAWQKAGYNRGQVEMDINRGLLTDDDKNRSKYKINEVTSGLIDAYSHIFELPVYVDDKPGLPTDEMRRRLEILMAREPISLVIVDHLGKAGDKGKSTFESTTLISNRLANITIEYNIPLIALCQLNREAEKDDRKDKRPRLSDLRSSGEIEQDARVVLSLYRDSYYTEDPAIPDLTMMWVLKNNEGESHQAIPFQCDQKSRQWKCWPTHRNPELEEYIKTKAWLPRRKKTDAVS